MQTYIDNKHIEIITGIGKFGIRELSYRNMNTNEPFKTIYTDTLDIHSLNTELPKLLKQQNLSL